MDSIKINLRRANFSDKDILSKWRNNIKIRENSFNSQIISKVEHEKWFDDIFKKKDVILLIGLINKKRVGQVRFNINGGIAKISVNVAPDKIHKGIGPILILKGSRFLFENTCCKKITAEIKPNNIASVKAFSKAKFKKISSEGNKILMEYIKQ
ncbi:GNAT family N-acetyltransferase [Patescibacteria group bacterium]|nr:GNAT family N-acetyltransferase [Patescibacteria group bacterium]MBU2472544.1 GNAT family N-acetyltransferase [Patescibacteria group bacterium]